MNRYPNGLGLYRTLLILYPRPFRAEYGPHMIQVFGDCLREAQTQGPGGVTQLWLATLLDLIKSALEERSRRGFTMTKEGFVHLGGPLWMLAGALILTSQLSGFETRWDDPLGGTDLWFELAGFLWTPALLLMLVGGIGFYQRYRQPIGRLGRFALVGAGLGAIASASGGLLLGLDLVRVVRSEFGWILFSFGLMVLLGNLVLLGIASLRRRPLSRWNALPLVLGLLPWLAFPLGDPAFEIIMALFAIGWILFGYAFFQDSAQLMRAEPAG